MIGMLHGLKLLIEAALFLLPELVGGVGQSDPSHWSVPRVACNIVHYYHSTELQNRTHVESLHNALDDLERSVILHG